MPVAQPSRTRRFFGKLCSCFTKKKNTLILQDLPDFNNPHKSPKYASRRISEYTPPSFVQTKISTEKDLGFKPILDSFLLIPDDSSAFCFDLSQTPSSISNETNYYIDIDESYLANKAFTLAEFEDALDEIPSQISEESSIVNSPYVHAYKTMSQIKNQKSAYENEPTTPRLSIPNLHLSKQAHNKRQLG